MEQKKRAARYKRNFVACSAAFYLFAAIGLGGLIGLVATIVVFELRSEYSVLFWTLSGSFAGGAVLGVLLAVLFSRLVERAAFIRRDFAERCVSEESFFIGEGTFATFEEGGLLVHGTGENTTRIRIPYADVRFFSVCTRRAPREKGEWSVVIEVPARYLAKKGKMEKNAPPLLVQADAKERLYRAIEAHGLELLGEKQGSAGGKFKPVCKYLLPHREKRNRALLFMALGGVLVAGGVVAAFLWSATIGAVIAAVGCILLGRMTMSFIQAKGVLGVYREGLYWKDVQRADRMFLKWEEIESISREQKGEVALLKVQCPYGAYHVPEISDSYEYLKNLRPEKVK